MVMLRAFVVLVCTTNAFLFALTFVDDALLQPHIMRHYIQKQAWPASRRSIVIYRVGDVPSNESSDVYENNLKFFSAAVMAHSSSAQHKALYIFRVVGGKRNRLTRHLPTNLANVLFTKCTKNSVNDNDMASHIHTIKALGDQVLSQFNSVLLLSHEARGPFEGHKGGAWWNRIVNTFNANPAVAIVGPLISCEVAPHVQSHGLTFRSETVLKILANFTSERNMSERINIESLEVAVTTSALSLGYQISSLAYARQWNKTVFDGTCHQSQGNYKTYSQNPISWCDFSPETSLFVRWGGEVLSHPGFYCQQVMDLIYSSTTAVADLYPAVHITLPETRTNGPLRDLTKEFDLERRDRKSIPTGKVCFLVRTSMGLSRQKSAQPYLEGASSVEMDLDISIPTLMHQTNPNWEAYFFVTDDQPFETELLSILDSYKDKRLHYLDLFMKFRPKYNPVDAAYPASDEALRLVMQQQPQCTRLSVTNGDNAYGSEVVASILSPTAPKADLILLPLDTRNFAAEDCLKRRVGYDGYCQCFEEKHLQHKYGFARPSKPAVGHVDIAAVFIDRHKFRETGIYFNAFNIDLVKVNNCKGCQDGTWVESMVTQHQWSVHSTPLDGLRHMVFHGPSPLWCLAAGHVWFDHPEKATCLSHQAVGKLPPQNFDLNSFHNGTRMCLRLSEEGFRVRQKA